ncbi:FAD-binding oxidoreductase [bacterium]|nr:FAD-binding oxidoreductase [bacterium]
MYHKINQSIIDQLKTIVEARNILTERDELLDYSHDEYSLDDISSYPDVVVKPPDAEAVSKIVQLCNQENIPLTARGGGTGLCGACVPVFGGVVMTFENMHQILEIDTHNLTATVESGLTLMDFYPAIEEKGLFFPPHPGDETATIGGVIATNAGGARAVKYGVIRNFVTGIEVVLPTGEIVNLGGKFVKNSTGYSLMHLMIGSEGTLGIITKATISLMAPPKELMTLVVPYDNLHDAISTVPAIIEKKILPMAVEFLELETAILSGKHLNKTWPCTQGSAHLMIIVDGTSEDEVMSLAETISEVCLDHNALEVFAADTRSKQRDILDIRSSIYEAMRPYMLEILDITVPRSQIAHFVDSVNAVAEKSDMWLPTYGHAADGNVHTHLMRYRWQNDEWHEIENWDEKYQTVRKELHDLGKKYQGICSGEHGIGIVKKEYLKSFLEPQQIELMRGIKKVFDPGAILNPGKIFD